MYKKETQLAFEDFIFPFGELDSENEWVKLAGLIPWDTVEREYSTSIRGWCQELRWLKFHSHVVQVFAVTFGVGGSSIRSHKWL